MPTLPLDHPEPFAATLGVMLYPGVDEASRRKAKAFATQYLAVPVRRFCEAGHVLSRAALETIVMDGGEPLDDLEVRWREGHAMGDLMKTLFARSLDHQHLCSWNNAIKVFELAASKARVSGSRSALLEIKRRYQSVAYLWGAWSIREGKFNFDIEISYDGWADFQSFLTEAEILRNFGQLWRSPRAKSSPLLPADL